MKYLMLLLLTQLFPSLVIAKEVVEVQTVNTNITLQNSIDYHILSKDNAKIRLSERNGNLFTFPSVRILSKPSAIQNEKAKTFIFIAEV